MYQAIFYTHVAVSFAALLSGTASLVIAVRGLIKKGEYLPWYRVVGKSYVIALYMQLAMGLLMYFYPEAGKGIMDSGLNYSGDSPSVPFWVIEHVSIMIFALFIVQIGCIFIGKTKNSQKKYKLILFYLGIPLLLMLFSLIMAMR